MKIKLLRTLLMAIKLSTYGLVVQVLCLGTIFAHESEAQVKSVNETYVNYEAINNTVGEVIYMIESNTDFSFYYVKADVDTDKRIDFTSSGRRTVADILLDVSKSSKLKFLQVNNNISISPISSSEIEQGVERVDVRLAIPVSGNVKDENNEGLPGVNVLIKGTTQGTVTDVAGDFNLEVPDENTVLVFSSVGYLTSGTSSRQLTR